MDQLKSVELIRDVLGRAEIGGQIISPSHRFRCVIIVEIERDTSWAAIDIDRRIVEAKPGPELSRVRRVHRQRLLTTGQNVGWERRGQRRQGRDPKQMSEGGQLVSRCEEAVR